MPKVKEAPAKQNIENEQVVVPSITDLEWTDFVLQQLSDDEKIQGNPTTDGLRRIFEKVMNCYVMQSDSTLVQAPEPSNDKRASVVHTITWYDLNPTVDENCRMRTVSGAADVYWGNCDKIYRNHPVAVAETRAEGRALRRALRLRKVVAAEEIAQKQIEEQQAEQDRLARIAKEEQEKARKESAIAKLKALGLTEEEVKSIL